MITDLFGFLKNLVLLDNVVRCEVCATLWAPIRLSFFFFFFCIFVPIECYTRIPFFSLCGTWGLSLVR